MFLDFVFPYLMLVSPFLFLNIRHFPDFGPSLGFSAGFGSSLTFLFLGGSGMRPSS